jgi:hypothetical protein
VQGFEEKKEEGRNREVMRKAERWKRGTYWSE